MITVRVSDAYIIAFDGAVLEAFTGAQGQRIHVGHIKKIQIKTDKNGKHTLDIDTIGGFPWITINEAAFARMSELVEAVQKAATEFQAAQTP